MIFILIESVMNGTVTMSTSPTGIEADDFEGAKKKLKSLKRFAGATIIFEGTTLFEYKIGSTSKIITSKIDSLPVYGRMDATPLRII